ncbi:MAG: hypothetical protein K0S65_1843 [Labilithrix sp.]|nr:hypothetical protein [Labilithrix sp.]
MRGSVLAAGLLFGTSIALLSPAVRAAPEEDTPDEIKLRDGRVLRGRVVESIPGRWVIIETEGRRRTFTWDTVAELDTAATPPTPTPTPPTSAALEATPAPAPPTTETTAASAPTETPSTPPAPATSREAWRRGGGMTYELRLEVSAIKLPERTFGLAGLCSTGTSTAPASIYGQSGSGDGVGIGGGIGARVGWMYRSRIDSEGASSWWALRVGTGLDVQALHADAPVGIRSIDGKLCSEVAKTRHEVKYESSAMLLAQIPFNLGAHLAFGKLDDTRWRGIVLGGAWTPSTVHVGMFSSAASSHFNYLGLELTVDFTVLHAANMRRPESHVRVALYFSPSASGNQPSIGTLSLGAVWY